MEEHDNAFLACTGTDVWAYTGGITTTVLDTLRLFYSTANQCKNNSNIICKRNLLLLQQQ